MIDSDNEKPERGKTREWIRRRKENGYFNNIIKELKVEDRLGSGKCSEWMLKIISNAFPLTGKSSLLDIISGLTELHSLNFWNVLTMYQNKKTLPFSDFERHHINIPFSMERLNVRIWDIFYMLDEKYQTNPT